MEIKTGFNLFVRQALLYPLTSPFLPAPADVKLGVSYGNGDKVGTLEGGLPSGFQVSGCNEFPEYNGLYVLKGVYDKFPYYRNVNNSAYIWSASSESYWFVSPNFGSIGFSDTYKTSEGITSSYQENDEPYGSLTVSVVPVA